MVLLLIAVCIAVGGTVAVGLAASLSPLWWLPLFLGMLVGFFLLYIGFIFAYAMIAPADHMRKRDDRFLRALFMAALPIFFFVAGARFEKTGLENVPRDGRFLLVANHLSSFDAFVMMMLFPHARLAFCSKPENFDTPIFGRLIRRLCFMPIDRESPIKAMTTVYHAADMLSRDECSIGIFPEGTRNKTERQLLPFHEGVFLIAKKGRVPVVVLTITNVHRICKNFPLRKTRISIRYAGMVSAEETTRLPCAKISARVHEMMAAGREAQGYPRDEIR